MERPHGCWECFHVQKYRCGRQTLIRTDSAGGTHDFVTRLAQRGRWLSYSVGMTVTEQIHQHVLKVPASAWTPAVETRDGVWVRTHRRRPSRLAEGDAVDRPEGTPVLRGPVAARRRRRHAHHLLRDPHDRPIAALELRHGSGPEPRTASGPPGPPAYAICPAPHRAGWRSCRSLSTCWPGC